jgi:very-short-patch-repair endonuclease
MECKDRLTDILKNYKCFSRRSLVKIIKQNVISWKLVGKTYFVNEEELLHYLKIDQILDYKDFNKNYFRMMNLSKKYNVTPKSILDYINKRKYIKAYLIMRHWYVNEKDLAYCIETYINKYKNSRLIVGQKQKDLEKRFDDVLGPEYQRLEPITSLRTKIKVLHKTCNTISLYTPDNTIWGGCRCPKCFKKRKYTIEQVREKIKDFSDGDYELVSTKYISNKKPILIRHTLKECHGHNLPFKTTLNSILNGDTSCPYCSMSSGEKQIFDFLRDNNINFVYQYHESSFRFDFKIDKTLFIEFDGKQHFEQVSDWDLEETYKRDLRKNQYVIDNNYTLIRISYKNFDSIKNILKEILLEKTFRDYPLGEYKQVLGKSVILSENIHYIG